MSGLHRSSKYTYATISSPIKRVLVGILFRFASSEVGCLSFHSRVVEEDTSRAVGTGAAHDEGATGELSVLLTGRDPTLSFESLQSLPPKLSETCRTSWLQRNVSKIYSTMRELAVVLQRMIKRGLYRMMTYSESAIREVRTELSLVAHDGPKRSLRLQILLHLEVKSK